MNEQELVETAKDAAGWLFDRRERLELHENEPVAYLWLAVGEVRTLIDGLCALEEFGLLRVEGRVLRDDLSELVHRADGELSVDF